MKPNGVPDQVFKQIFNHHNYELFTSESILDEIGRIIYPKVRKLIIKTDRRF